MDYTLTVYLTSLLQKLSQITYKASQLAHTTILQIFALYSHVTTVF